MSRPSPFDVTVPWYKRVGFDSLLIDHIEGREFRVPREGRDFIVWRVVGKEQSFEFDCSDPVAQLVSLTHGNLQYLTPFDLFDEHEGDVEAAHLAWRTLESIQHASGVNPPGEGSSHTTVRSAATSGAHQVRLDLAREPLVERRFHDGPTHEQASVQTYETPVSSRSSMAMTARTQNSAVREVGGNTFHYSILGNPVLVAASEPLVFQALTRFMLEIRRAPTPAGLNRAAQIHTEYIDLCTLQTKICGKRHPKAYTSYGLGIFAAISDPDLLDLLTRIAAESEMYAWYVRVTIFLGFDPTDRLVSGITALRRVAAHIAMYLSSYAPCTHTRGAHASPPPLGGVYELESLGRMHHALLATGGGNIDVILVDILPSFPGRTNTLSGDMRDVYAILGSFSPCSNSTGTHGYWHDL